MTEKNTPSPNINSTSLKPLKHKEVSLELIEQKKGNNLNLQFRKSHTQELRQKKLSVLRKIKGVDEEIDLLKEEEANQINYELVN